MHVSLISDEKVEDLTQGKDYTVNDRQVTLAAPTGLKIKIYRVTTTKPLVGWADASVLRAADMTVQSTQLLHLAEETSDLAQDGGLSKDTADNIWDARYNKIKNLLDPTDPGDAVTLHYITKNQNSLINQLNATGDSQNTRLISTGNTQNASLVHTGNTQNSRLNTTGDTQNDRLEATGNTQNTRLNDTGDLQNTRLTTTGNKYVSTMTSLKDTTTLKATEANNSAALAKKWAVSDSSPDGASDSKSAKTWAGEAKVSASNAVSAASASASSATASQNSATASASSATTATQKATAAASSASAASTSASNAATSATNAKASETKAASSASAAKQSEENAKTWDPTQYVQSVTESNGKVTVTKGGGESTTFNAGYTSPTEYRRDELPVSGRTTITISKTRVVINGHLLETTGNALSLSQSTYWDNEKYVTAANRAGKDFYIYACIPDSGTEPKFILSANSTVPTGYTADNSRKIGGFHCLCASVGTISGHSLSGYITGDILPASVWDLLHRCKGENEGMVYDAYDDVWIGIYLLSYDNGRAVSRFNGVILDGTSTPKTHGLWFTETLAKQKMRLPYLHEFFTALKGCQEQVNISGSKDWNTTGGHVYTNNVRCISNIGLEDPTGFMWQLSNNYGMAGGSEWGQSAYDSQVDSVNRGGTYGNLWLPLVGGKWNSGSNCGSRSVDGSNVAAHRSAVIGARPASESRVVIL